MLCINHANFYNRKEVRILMTYIPEVVELIQDPLLGTIVFEGGAIGLAIWLSVKGLTKILNLEVDDGKIRNHRRTY